MTSYTHESQDRVRPSPPKKDSKSQVPSFTFLRRFAIASMVCFACPDTLKDEDNDLLDESVVSHTYRKLVDREARHKQADGSSD